MEVTPAQLVPFVHPSIAGFALAAGVVPILVHLINRRRYRRVRWAAMSFLLTANRRSSKRVFLEQWLLLIVRIAAVVLFGLAVARPYFPASALSPIASSHVHRVLLIDNSLSMNARVDDKTARFTLAKGAAERLLASFPRTDAVSIVTLAEPATAVVAHPSFDRRFVKERLSGVVATQRGTDFVGAIAAAHEILDDSEFPEQNRAVYLISDMPDRSFAAPSPGTVAPVAAALRALAGKLAKPSADMNIIQAARGPAPNVAVTDLRCESTLASVGLPIRFQAEVTNFSTVTTRGLSLEVRRGGQIIRRQPLTPIEPGRSAVAEFAVAPSAPGTYAYEARVLGVADDGLAEDNVRFVSVEVRDATPVLLVDGRLGPTPLSGQTGYLATALAPGYAGHRTARAGDRAIASPDRFLMAPKIIGDAEFDAEALDEFGVVALCNVRRLTPEQWKRLELFVSRGGGLIVFAGDLVAVDHYNRLGYAEGAGLLPGTLDRAAPRSSGDDAVTTVSTEGLTHSIVSRFADHPESGLFLARIDRYLPVRTDPARGDVVLQYADGNAALIAGDFGRGRVLLCTTTASMDWNSLPAKGDYVSLMLNAFSHLAPARGAHRNIVVGRSIHELLSPRESSLPLRVAGGGGSTRDVRLVSADEALAAAYGPTESAGTIALSIGDDVRDFAVNIDVAESDLATVDAEAIEAAMGGSVRFVSDASAVADPGGVARAGELALAVLWLVVVLLLSEVWIAYWFGSRRSVAG